jgi:hypothetical protein
VVGIKPQKPELFSPLGDGEIFSSAKEGAQQKSFAMLKKILDAPREHPDRAF